jgi:site-specific recombinase XerD
VNKYLSAIRQTLKQAWKLGQMFSEDYYRAVSVKNEKSERLPRGRHINASEIGTMLTTCEQNTTGIRDAAILSLRITTGLRRVRLAAVDIADYQKNYQILLQPFAGIHNALNSFILCTESIIGERK